MDATTLRRRATRRRRPCHCGRALVLASLVLSLQSPAAPVDDTDACGPDARRAAYAPYAFLGYACRDDDCAAHKAGFAWADRSGITDARACADAENAAFAEGCRAFADDAVTAEQAGFQWARENEVDDACRCRGGGPRFEAGCEAYVAGSTR